MSIYRPTSQRRVLLAVLILASITVITLDFRSSGGVFGGTRDAVGAALSPVRRAASAVISPATRFFSGVARANSIRDENERLRKELADLRSKVDATGRDAAELEDLKKLNNIPLPKGIVSVGAHVFATGPSSFEWTVEIDAGSDRGVAVGNPVVSGDGLVGRVVSVRGGSAVVQLVVDPGFAAGARLERSREVGVVSGHGTGPLTLDVVDPQTPVEIGERIFTAGGPSSGFPPEIPIGTVRNITGSSASLQRTIEVEPAVKSRRLEFVKVLLYSGQRR